MNLQEKMWYDELYDLIKGDYSQAVEDQCAVWEGRKPENQPLLLHCGLDSEQYSRFPDYNPGEVHGDKVKMLLDGMKNMLSPVLGKMQAVPSIRANMGCGIFPSLFPGIEPLLFDDDRMPWVTHHLTREDISKLSEKDIKITDEFKLALEHMANIAEHIDGTGAYIYPLDLQGPFDIAHIVYGDSIFYDLYDEPELIHHLLNLSVYATNLGLDECLKIIPKSDKIIAHYNSLVIPRSLGGIKVSEDTSTLLSSEHIDEFVIPYLNKILEHAGGGYVHYCGKNDYLFDRVIEQELVRGLNFGNPEKHDMPEILRRVSKAGKVYFGGIPKLENESLKDYFARIVPPAVVEGKCKLLLEMNVSFEELENVKSAWIEASVF